MGPVSLPRESTIAIDTDKYGVEYYAGPVPGCDASGVHDYREMVPHIPYFHYSDRTTTGKAKSVYKNLYKGANCPMKYQLLAFDEVGPDNSGGLRFPFGMSFWKGDKEDSNDDFRQNVAISLDTPELLNFFKKLDERNMEVAIRRSEEWFDAVKSREVLEDKYTPLVAKKKPSAPKPGQTEMNFSPTMRAKINLPGGKTQRVTEVYEKVGVDDDGTWVLNPADARHHLIIPPGERRKIFGLAVVEDRGIWLAAGKFGNTLEITSLILLPINKAAVPHFVGGKVRQYREEPAYGLPDHAQQKGLTYPLPQVGADFVPEQPLQAQPMEADDDGDDVMRE